MKSAAWIQSLSGLPFSTIADPIRAADQAIAHSTSSVNDFLEDVIMFCFLSASTFNSQLYASVRAKDNDTGQSFPVQKVKSRVSLIWKL